MYRKEAGKTGNVYAPSTGVDMFLNISGEFMKKIFNCEPDGYLISDESTLFDFTGLDEMELTDIEKRIQDVYDLDVSDIDKTISIMIS